MVNTLLFFSVGLWMVMMLYLSAGVMEYLPVKRGVIVTDLVTVAPPRLEMETRLTVCCCVFDCCEKGVRSPHPEILSSTRSS